jgi:hypothetical protein
VGLDLAEAHLLCAADLIALLDQLGGGDRLLPPATTCAQRKDREGWNHQQESLIAEHCEPAL